MLKNVDPLGLDSDPEHAAAQKAYVAETNERAKVVAAETAKLAELETSFVEASRDGNVDEMNAAWDEVAAQREAMDDSARKWSSREAELARRVDETRDCWFADGSGGSIRMRARARASADIQEVNRQAGLARDTGVMAPLAIAVEAVLPSENRADRANRLAFWGHANLVATAKTRPGRREGRL